MRALPLCLALIFLLPHCGGTTTASEPKSAADRDGDSSNDSSDDSDDSDDAEAKASPADDKPKGPSCDDGTCSLCGSGICPSGWYCDENAKGGPACSWLKECADKPSCACVTRVLGPTCKCSDASGLKVSCN